MGTLLNKDGPLGIVAVVVKATVHPAEALPPHRAE